MNIRPLSVTEENAQSHMITDPSTVALFAAVEDGGQPMIGQWDGSSDPLQLFETIERYVRRLASFMGISGADQVRMSGDPRSGYAVSVSREAQREQVRRLEPMSRRADERVIALVAGLLNAPTSGYTLTYRGIPLSTDERRALQAEVFELIEQGMLTRFEGFQRLNPELSEREAAARFAKIQQEKPSPPMEATTRTPAEEAPSNVPSETGTGAAPAPQEVLNGAQVQSAVAIVQAVGLGSLNRSQALNMLQSFFKLDLKTAQSLLVGAESNKEPVNA